MGDGLFNRPVRLREYVERVRRELARARQNGNGRQVERWKRELAWVTAELAARGVSRRVVR